MTSLISLLFVEGNRTDRLLLHTALGRCGAGVTWTVCASAEEAMHHLATAPLPDLVVTAADLQGVDGAPFLKMLCGHAAWQALPVVVWGRSRERHVLPFSAAQVQWVEKGETLGAYIRGLGELLRDRVRAPLSA